MQTALLGGGVFSGVQIGINKHCVLAGATCVYGNLYIRVHSVPKNRARILWPITFTNIDQYHCQLIELFLQHYLIIYHKNYSHSRVSAAIVTMATSALVKTNICAITACWPIVQVPLSSIVPGHT